MYQPPQQTFFYEDTPPSSPQNKPLPTFHISPSPAIHNDVKARKRQQREEKSKLKHPPPFSFEYVVRDGQMAGLAEFNPDRDYLHYSSSSRGSSRITSRNPSTNPSPRTSTVERQSGEVDRSMAPPPSPKKTDKLKRALSFSNSKDKKRRAPPPPVSEKLPLCTIAATEKQSPKQSSKQASVPFSPTPPQSPRKPFEEPRPAPQPPLKNMFDASRHATPPSTPKHSFEVSRTVAKKVSNGPLVKQATPPTAQTEKSFQGPARRPTIITSPVSSDIMQKQTRPLVEQPSRPAPPLRRKTSKFIEHIDNSPPPQEQTKAVTPAVPSLPPISPFDFQLPATSLPDRTITRSVSTANAPTNTVHPQRPTLTSKTESKPRSEPQKLRGIMLSTSKHEQAQPQPNNITRKHSAFNLEARPTRVPIPASVLKRTMSTQTRRPTMWTDVCMAEVKPILMGRPIVAMGHARMVSC